MGDFLNAILMMIIAFAIIMLLVFGLQWVVFWLLNKLFRINIPIAWDKATTNSLYDTLLTYGSEEVPSVSAGANVMFIFSPY